MALTETLKLFFNLSQFYPEQIPTLTKALPNILKLLVNAKDPSPPLQPPISSMINALINLDLEGKRSNHFTHNPLFPIIDTKCNVNRFIGILDTSIRHYSEEELEQRAIPITALVKRCYEYAPDLIKSHIRTLLLPSNSERVQPLGQADTLPGRLLRLSTSAVAPNLRETISTLLFELSDKDARRFVRNVGYGFASGFLMTHNVPIPENAMEAWSTGSESIKSNSVDSDDEGPTRREKKETKGSTSEDGEDVEEITPSSARHAINPITGQRLDMEPDDFGPEMTEDEKIREAERLFVLFER